MKAKYMQVWQIAFQRKALSQFKRNTIDFISHAQPVSLRRDHKTVLVSRFRLEERKPCL